MEATMSTARDVRDRIGWIGGSPGIAPILRSLLYKTLASDGDDIEVWLERSSLTLPYYWLVSHKDGFPRRLALVRFNANTEELQERIGGVLLVLHAWRPLV